MDDDDFRPRAYPPSIVIGGAGLVVVLAGIVVSVLMVSAASVDVARLVPAAPVPVVVTPTATASAVADQPSAPNNLDGFIAHLTPQLPAFDQLLHAP